VGWRYDELRHQLVYVTSHGKVVRAPHLGALKQKIGGFQNASNSVFHRTRISSVHFSD
jgi:hypothetical protein